MLEDYFTFSGLTLTRAADGDLDQIVALTRQAFAEAEKLCGESYTSLDDLRSRRQRGYEIYAIKKSATVVAAFLVLPKDDDLKNALYFGRLVVRESWRGRGLGAHIVEAIIAYAKELKREAVSLNFLKISPRLEGYYGKFGFRCEGEPFLWKGLEVVPMRLPLKG